MATATLETPAEIDFASAPLDESQFIVLDDVAVFAEHVTAFEGEDEVYDKSVLESMCRNNNLRIEDTGDYVPIILRHTPNPGEEDRDPEVVGFAGPFKLGRLGRKRPRAAIFARFRIFKDRADVIRKYPRRSVEVWAEENLHDRFIDPISLLAGETPRLDLGLPPGLHYRRLEKGRQVRKYAAVAPGGANVFVPTDGTTQEKRKMALTPEDIQQVVNAIQQTDVFQWAASKMAEETGPAPTVPQADAAGLGADPLADDDTNVEAFRKYQEDGDDKGAKDFLGILGDEDRTKLKRAMCEGDDPKSKEFYERAAGSVEDDVDGKASATVAEKYRRENVDLKRKYAMKDGENKVLEQRVAALERENRRSVRYSRLDELAKTHMLDVAAELEETIDLSDDQFEKHEARIRERYQRIPVERRVYSGAPIKTGQSDADAEARAKRAVNIAQSEGISYEAALAKA